MNHLTANELATQVETNATPQALDSIPVLLGKVLLAVAEIETASPSWDDQEITTLAAVNQGDPITATGLSHTPIGRIDVYNTGGQRWRIGDGVKTKDIYFSGNGGTTARAHAAIVLGDIPYLGTTGADAGGVPSGEAISICYNQ